MKIIDRYYSAHFMSVARDNKYDFGEIGDNEHILWLQMYNEDYDSMDYLHDWGSIMLRLGRSQFEPEQGEWHFLTLLELGALHNLDDDRILLIWKVKEKELNKVKQKKAIKEMI